MSGRFHSNTTVVVPIPVIDAGIRTEYLIVLHRYLCVAIVLLGVVVSRSYGRPPVAAGETVHHPAKQPVPDLP